MKIPNEITVQNLLSFDESSFLKKIEELKEDLEIFKGSNSIQRAKQELALYQGFIDTLNEARDVVKKNKFDKNQKIGIAFVPKFKKIKEDCIISKIGGVPFYFIRELKDLLNDKTKAYEQLRKIYPKNHQGTYLKFVGDLDTESPTFFINQVSDVIVHKDEKINVLYHQNKYHQKQKTMNVSLFIDEFSNSGSLTPDGAFYTNIYIDKYSKEEVDQYVNILTEFIKKEVDNEPRISVDKFKLTEIEGWDLQIEIPSEQNELEGIIIYPSKRVSNYFKLFGYAESQQSVYPYYCINGNLGPRLLTPFLSINSKDDDNCIQIYSDLLQFNCSQESMTHLKVVISGT